MEFNGEKIKHGNSKNPDYKRKVILNLTFQEYHDLNNINRVENVENSLKATREIFIILQKYDLSPDDALTVLKNSTLRAIEGLTRLYIDKMANEEKEKMQDELK